MSQPSLPAEEIVESVTDLWGTALVSAGCPQCHRSFLIAQNRLGQVCPGCARGRLEAQPARLRREPPELLLPFAQQRAQVQFSLTNFLSGLWLRPNDLNVETLLNRVVPIYWPMWLVDACVDGHWQAEVGYDYQVKSSQESYIGGSWQTREVVETRIRWEPRLGQISRSYENIPAPALSNHARLLEQIGNYDLDRSEPYTTAQAEPAVVVVPDQPPESAWPLARGSLERAAAADCRQAAAGQHIRDFIIDASYSDLHWTHLLLPLYVTFYTGDDGTPYPVYINGQTGKVSGLRLASQRKGWMWGGILAAIAVGLLLLALLSFALAPLAPPLSLAGVILGVLAFALGASSLIPILWPWQWNRRQQDRTVVNL